MGDICMMHGDPEKWAAAGHPKCKEAIERAQPGLCLFGHHHRCYGVKKPIGRTIPVNSAMDMVLHGLSTASSPRRAATGGASPWIGCGDVAVAVAVARTSRLAGARCRCLKRPRRSLALLVIDRHMRSK